MTTGGDDRLSDLSVDRLSNLSDDLLRRILYFAPSKEAAKTSVLSRRWGSIWRSSGAVNLTVQVWSSRQSREYGASYSYEEAEDAFYSCQEAFVRAAKAALDAAEAPITSLTLRVESDDHDGDSSINKFLSRNRNWNTHYRDADVVGALLSHQAARHVEELRVAAVAESYGLLRDTGFYGLASLPSSDTLRVLELTRCNLNLTAAFPLPRLATLRLRYCKVEPKVLQALLLDAAPELTTVELESLFFSLPTTESYGLPPWPDELDGAAAGPEPPVLRLSFQAVTTLVLSSCGMHVQGSGELRGSSWAIEIDAPRLQSFKYMGPLRPFVLRPAAAGVALVDLHFLQNNYANISALFWQFVHNFTNARTVKLKVGNNLMDAIGKASHTLQCAFPSVERLELEGAFDPLADCPEGVRAGRGGRRPPRGLPRRSMVPRAGTGRGSSPEIGTAAKAIANLLDRCPVLGEFMLKLRGVSALPVQDSPYGQEFLKRKHRSDYSKSIDRFVRRRKSKTAIHMEDSDSSFGDKYSYDEVPGIPGLSDRSFACLQRTLRRVGLQFRLDNNSISSDLGLRLIKFFADHARVLEEMCVDTGNRRLQEHLNFNVETQALALAPQLQCGNTGTLDSTVDLAKSTTGFTVLPLQRQERMD